VSDDVVDRIARRIYMLGEPSPGFAPPSGQIEKIVREELARGASDTIAQDLPRINLSLVLSGVTRSIRASMLAHAFNVDDQIKKIVREFDLNAEIRRTVALEIKNALAFKVQQEVRQRVQDEADKLTDEIISQVTYRLKNPGQDDV
jgi:hypothetical protein